MGDENEGTEGTSTEVETPGGTKVSEDTPAPAPEPDDGGDASST